MLNRNGIETFQSLGENGKRSLLTSRIVEVSASRPSHIAIAFIIGKVSLTWCLCQVNGAETVQVQTLRLKHILGLIIRPNCHLTEPLCNRAGAEKVALMRNMPFLQYVSPESLGPLDSG